jgi:hypothetical protein
MKNLLLLGVLFFSSVLNSSAFAQNEEVPETPEIIIDSLVGTADGFSVRNGDDKLDFGLVIPTLTKAQVMDFNLSYVLSSETSVIRAVGQRINVPSNLSLPQQSERYSFFTIRIDKPEFILPIATAELPPEIVILEGNIPFANTVDTLRSGKPLFAVINSFTFESYSLSPVDAPTAPQELTVGASSIEGEQVEFKSPLAEDPEFVTLGLNLASSLQEDGTLRHFPIDIKTLEFPEFLKTDAESVTTPLVVSIPKDVFESAADASSMPFPFTMVWGEASPDVSLPLAKEFVSVNADLSEINIEFSNLNNVDVLGMNSSFLDADGNLISSTFTVGGFQGTISVLVPENTVRARVDVYAVDADPIKTSMILENALSEDDILVEAKYITRYEEDLN